MFTKFKSKLQTIFVDSSTDKIGFVLKSREKINVILSPSFYWVQKVALPVKYVRDAKKLLPSLFEDILPEGNYSYSAYKEGEDFYIFAYEDKKIIDLLLSKGISTSAIANVYFAQSEFASLSEPKKINEHESIYVKEGLVVLVPSAWVQSDATLEIASDISEHKLSKHTIRLQQFGHIVNNKSLYKIGAIVLVLIALLLSEYLITAHKVDEVSRLKEEIFEKYKLKSTTFANEALFKKYDSIYQRQSKMREYLGLVLDLKLATDEKISFISFKNNTLHCEFSGVSKGRDAVIMKFLKSKGVNCTAAFKANSWNLELSL